jgi:triphosphatase
METELKLSIDAADREKLRRLPLLERHAEGKPQQADMVAHYFDTPDFHVRRHDAELRVRKAGGEWMQTLKAGGSVGGGLHRRHEWECPVEGERPDLEKLRGVVDRDTEWAAMLNTPSLANRLQLLFTVCVTRTTWDLRIDSSRIELLLDEGTIAREGKTLALSEIELELKSGKAESLYDFALQLLADIPLRLSNRSKAERGYRLCSQSGGVVVKARPPSLSKDCTVEQGLQAILAACLDQIRGNEAGIIEQSDSESLHQMRVGLRRLRAALRLFGQVAPCPAPLRDEIAWLAAELGAARDWDVLSTSTLARVAEAPAGKAQLMSLQDAVLDMVRARRGQAAQALLSTRYTRLLIAVFAWMQGAHWRHEPDAESARRLDEPLEEFARAMIRRGHRKLVRRAGKAADARGRHRLRIAGKNNRYAMEFFQPLFSSRRVRRYLSALQEMQEELGWRNDMAVADGLLQQLPEEQIGAAFARGYLIARLGADNGALRTMRKKIRRLKPPLK